jgi:hypothetical protein
MVQGQTSYPIIGPIAKFSPGGKSGLMISDLMEHTRGIADDICVIRTMHTEHVNHDPASKFLHTGFQIAGRPSTGRPDRRRGVGQRLHAVALSGRALPLG